VQRRNVLILLVLIVVSLIITSYFTLAQLNLLGTPTQTMLSPTSPQNSPSTTTTETSTSTTSPTLTPTPTPTYPTFNLVNSTKTIVRTANTEEERTALQTAEYFDYTKTTNGTLQRGEYANFIDTSVINYYSSKADSYRYGITLKYQASSNAWTQAKVRITDNSIQLTSPSKATVSLTKTGWSQATFAYLNNTQYIQAKEGIVNIDLASCYIVSMDLQVSEVLGPTNGFWNTIQQIVILNDSFEPVAFGMQSQNIQS
jgi:hypothetical protein